LGGFVVVASAIISDGRRVVTTHFFAIMRYFEKLGEDWRGELLLERKRYDMLNVPSTRVVCVTGANEGNYKWEKQNEGNIVAKFECKLGQ
jgi:hypothetical protein